MTQRYYTETDQAKAFKALLLQLEERLKLSHSVNVYLAGGMAVHLYTQNRMTMDVDAEFDARIAIPNDVLVDVEQGDGSTRPMYIDTNYNSTFALMHPGYRDDAEFIDFGLRSFRVHVLQPVDLAVSKIARFQDMDREDIRALVLLGLTTADAIKQRADEAVDYFVGGQEMLKFNIRDAVALARSAEEEARRVQGLYKLRERAGTGYTLWEKANQALSFGSAKDVDWGAIEQAVIEESIGEHGQSPDDVADTLCEWSPGATTTERQEALRKEVFDRAPELQARFAARLGGREALPTAGRE
ncbi:MAG: DUF6036 family nucleotidyltransferase [Rhodanobacter sp.]|jgi:hypothetical protein